MEMKEHPKYNNYLITTKGDVIAKKYYGINKKKILKQAKTGLGYPSVCIHSKVKLVHRLVGQTFIPNPLNKPEINHKNGIKDDNRVENLEWCTSSENSHHSYDLGLQKPPKNMLGKFGKNNPLSKKVEQIDVVSGKIIKIWDSFQDITRETRIHYANIHKVCNGKRKTCAGFNWRYHNV